MIAAVTRTVTAPLLSSVQMFRQLLLPVYQAVALAGVEVDQMLTVGVTRCANTVETAAVTGKLCAAQLPKHPALQCSQVLVVPRVVARTGVEVGLTRTVGVIPLVKSQETAAVIRRNIVLYHSELLRTKPVAALAA